MQFLVSCSPNVARKLSSLHMPQPAHNDGKLHFSFPTFYLRKERKSASCPKPNRPPPLAPAQRLSAPWRWASGPELCTQFLRSHRQLWGWDHHQLPGPARARRTPGESPPLEVQRGQVHQNFHSCCDSWALSEHWECKGPVRSVLGLGPWHRAGAGAQHVHIVSWDPPLTSLSVGG